MFVKSMTWYVLPAAPWASPSLRPSERIGQAGAAPATVGLAEAVAGVGRLSPRRRWPTRPGSP